MMDVLTMESGGRGQNVISEYVSITVHIIILVNNINRYNI